MSRVRIGLLAACALAASGCGAFYSAPVVPAAAGLYMNTRAPLDTEFDETELGDKTGKASVRSVLWLIAWGDASAAAAAQDGGIETIRHADYEFLSVLGVYQSFTTVVHGD
jgi:hypothetical protein